MNGHSDSKRHASLRSMAKTFQDGTLVIRESGRRDETQLANDYCDG